MQHCGTPSARSVSLAMNSCGFSWVGRVVVGWVEKIGVLWETMHKSRIAAISPTDTSFITNAHEYQYRSCPNQPLTWLSLKRTGTVGLGEEQCATENNIRDPDLRCCSGSIVVPIFFFLLPHPLLSPCLLPWRCQSPSSGVRDGAAVKYICCFGQLRLRHG